MEKVRINEELCKGCGLCVDACPDGGILAIDTKKINAKGWNPAVCKNQEGCKSCALCALMCPDAAIEVYK